MDRRQLLLDYMYNFRLECHFRLDMVPGDVSELPIFMYERASESVIDDMKETLNLNEEELEAIDKVKNFFINKLQELDHYTKADDLTVKKIEAGDFD